MAAGFLVCPAPDLHIGFLLQHHSFVHSYLEGSLPPELESPQSVPDWWPQTRPKTLTSWSVNYRNTDLYHWILNGTPDLTSGSGAIFQSWYKPEHPATVLKLDKHNERFALYSEHLDELASLVNKVNVDSVLNAFTGWCKGQGKEWRDIDQYACEPFVEEFHAFGSLLTEALQKRQGIIW